MRMNRLLGVRPGVFVLACAALLVGIAPPTADAIVFVYACLCCRPDGSIVYKTGWTTNGCAGFEGNPLFVACDDLFTAFVIHPSGGVGNGYAPAFDRAVPLGSPIPGGPGAPETRIVQGYYPAADVFSAGSYHTTVFAIRPAGIPGAPNFYAPIAIDESGLSPSAHGMVLTTIRPGDAVPGPYDVGGSPLSERGDGIDAYLVLETYDTASPNVAIDTRLIPVNFDALTWQAAPDLPPACVGDCDRSGQVTFADITAVLANFNRSYPVGVLTPGDAQGDRVVNFSDVTAVLANFGQTCE
ncbi:MAG: hypothetical protein JNK58_09120 [Phycisphaerae bacterium]|nr:hypothetical protein [Phycisphaerae bacterium]